MTLRSLSLAAPALLGACLAAAPAAAQEPIERDVCAGCHEEAETFAGGPHGRAMARRDPALLERSCVGCHGDATEHVEDPNPENIVRLPGPDACASCHGEKGGQLSLTNPAHQRHGLGCLSCHVSGHGEPGGEPLLAEEPFALCGGCHGEQRSAAYRPFAHRDGAQPFACTSCHSAHGTGRTARLAAFERDGACLDCHTEKAGPFVFPHPSREVSGCIECHEPHGSTNPRLLTRHQVLSLCLECHAGIPSLHDLTRARFRSCTSCHVAVHGSNRDPRLFDE